MKYLPPKQVSSMEPLLPKKNSMQLKELAAQLIKSSSSLSSSIHPITANAVKELLRAMNSYYSNLIEGQSTNPLSIEAALKSRFETDPHEKKLQKLAVAHIQTQKIAEKVIFENPTVSITHIDFIKFLHKEFYSQLPVDFLKIKDPGENKFLKLSPGELRTQEVSIGSHIPPASAEITRFMTRFHQAYSASTLDPLERIIAGAAAHHRLAWIHPFLDGNGRVTRLFSDCFFMKENLGGFGLWTISRGFARYQKNYYEALSIGDDQRKNDHDGRGALSDESLSSFCSFFLKTAIDQVNFMSSQLQLDFFEKRLNRFIGILEDTVSIRHESVFLLRELFLRGEVPRGEIPRIVNLHERVSRKLVADLIRFDLIKSETPKSNLFLNFHPLFAHNMFPSLYPETLDMTDYQTIYKK
jgi:Fic family protein